MLGRRLGEADVRRIALVAAVVVSVGMSWGVPTASPQPAPPVQIRVMSFNIWYGATPTDGLDEVIRAIETAQADVVGMQEPYARLRRIADALGFYVSPRMHVISRYPILQPDGGSYDFAYLSLAPGEVAAISNTHLPCCPYTPYRIVHKGMSRVDALEQERNTRLGRIRKHLDGIASVLSAGVPTFFTGDFNSPSHRDWTPEAIDSRGLPYTIRWPVAAEMEGAGFVDSYRAVHPDPVADPGYTWTPGYPAPFVYDWDVHDRIDFVWAAGPATPTESLLVGESRANADIVIRPYPADHRGVVSTFDVVPAEPPVMVAAYEERSRLGRPFEVTFHAPGDPGDHVALETAGGATIDEQDVGPVLTDGTMTFDTAGLEQGMYRLVLFDADHNVLARDTIVLVEDDQPPVLTVNDDTLRGDQALEVSWSFAPGNRYDWLAIYRAGVSAKVGYYKAWRYMDGLVEGSATLGPGARGYGGWPLKPGDYDVRICLDDSYRCRVSVPFTVLG
jgi:endonuclease/exonuclease/phosphatase family metal-dependent hydrolase